MIAFGCAITRPDVYARCAEPGIRRAAEPDSAVLKRRTRGTLFENYNALLDEAARLPGLEALVLVHQDTEIVDPDFCARVRAALADESVGVVGCVGAVGVRSIAWWEGSVSLASFVHRFDEHGGGDLPSFSWTWDEAPPYARVGEVDTLDGFLLALPAWTVERIRFDEALGTLHGYDLDFCLQVREAGRKAVTADLKAIHHHSLELVSAPEQWVRAHIRIAEKWDGRMPGIGAAAGTWKERARRAEAERDAAGLESRARMLQMEARARELERAIEEARTSISWRVTAPLRRAARLRPPAGRRTP
jgi:hypothetical protein